MLTFTEIPARILKFLDDNACHHTLIPHDTDYTALKTARHTYTPRLEFAKTVVLLVDGAPAIAALPAHHRIDFDKLTRLLVAKSVELAPETTIKELFPDCEVGAEPPLGKLYQLPLYVSAAMASDDTITFNAGTHDCALQMSYDDFERTTRPRILNFSVRAYL